MPARRIPKVEALVVNAIRRLQDVQGSTSREISNYISQEYNVPSEETRRQVQFALRRGLSYGILNHSKGGYYSCNRDYFGSGNGTGDGVMEPCPSQPWRFGVRERKRKRRRARLLARERRRRQKREKARKRAVRRRGARSRRRRRPSRRRRRRRRGRRSRSRRRSRTRGRRRRRRGGRRRTRVRARTRSRDPGEIEMAPMRNDADRKDEDPRKSETSTSVHSRNSPPNSQALNTPDYDEQLETNEK